MEPEVAYRPSGAVSIGGHQVGMGNPGLAWPSLLRAGRYCEGTDSRR
jgi:hypothetical protein